MSSLTSFTLTVSGYRSGTIDLSYDGWVSVNDILMEEGHAYEYDGGKKKVFKG